MTPISHAVVLGILQGLTEFLPISSSAHLILVPRFLGWQDPGLAFDVALHLGTLAGVLLYFRKELQGLIQACFLYRDAERAPERRLAGYLILATIPAGAIGLLYQDHIESAFRDPSLIAYTLMGMGILLWVADRFMGGKRTLWDLNAGCAVAIGAAQSLALVPGVSRSGVTMTCALMLGFSRTETARFSFLMSIPIIAGAGLVKSGEIFRSPDHLAILCGFTASAIAGLFAIWALIKIVQRYRYTPFVVYRVALGILILWNLSSL